MLWHGARRSMFLVGRAHEPWTVWLGFFFQMRFPHKVNLNRLPGMHILLPLFGGLLTARGELPGQNRYHTFHSCEGWKEKSKQKQPDWSFWFHLSPFQRIYFGFGIYKPPRAGYFWRPWWFRVCAPQPNQGLMVQFSVVSAISHKFPLFSRRPPISMQHIFCDLAFFLMLL